MEIFHTIALSLGLGILSYLLDRRFRVPAIVFLLSAGLICGPMVLDILHPEILGKGLIVLVEIAVAFILFEGGISLSTSGFKSEAAAIHRLLFGTLTLTGIGASFLACLLLGVNWKYSLLFGSIIIVTGPTVMGSILRNVDLKPRLEVLLHWESIWGDVAGVIVSAVALELLVYDDTSMHIALAFAERVAIGIIVGISAGYILRRFVFPFAERLHDELLPGLIACGSAVGIFSIANLIKEGSGPLCVVLMGLMLTRLDFRLVREIRHFNELIGVLLIGTLFVLLSAEVDLRILKPYWFKMAVVGLVLGMVVRPLAVFVSLHRSRVTFREQIYIAFIGPRGILAMASMAYAASLLGNSSVALNILTSTVFGIILLSGITATIICKPLARILKVDAPVEKMGVLIVGLNELSVAIANFIKPYVPVAFIDTSPTSCRLISEAGLSALCADVVDETIYEEAIQVGYARLLIVTPDDALNELVAAKAGYHFGARNVYKAKGYVNDDLLLVGPVARFVPAFSNRLIVSSVLHAIRKGKARLNIYSALELQNLRKENIIPLVDVDEENERVRILTPQSIPSGRVLCVVFDYASKEEQDRDGS